MTVDGLLYDPARPDPAVLTIDGPDYYADGWAARLQPTGPVPTHTRGCTFAAYEVPAEVCACTVGTAWLRQQCSRQHRHHPH